MKYLVILVVLVLAYAWLRRPRPGAPPPERPPLPAPQDMVACARCGLHLPGTEALTAGKRSYCCIEHQREDGF